MRWFDRRKSGWKKIPRMQPLALQLAAGIALTRQLGGGA